MNNRSLFSIKKLRNEEKIKKPFDPVRKGTLSFLPGQTTLFLIG